MKKLIYRIYKKTENNRLTATAAFFLYHTLRPLLTGKEKTEKYTPEKIAFEKRKYRKKELKELKIAVICDDMTYENLKETCDVVFLRPDCWLSLMQEERPDVFFCESAWSGIAEYRDCWRGKIYKNHRLLSENRKVLSDILDYCRRSGIPTMFWNKEDPLYFGDELHDFADTALRFDYIFTTAEECVEKYRDRGHEKVFQLSFGFSPKLFYCEKGEEKENKAVFAGSWYGDHPERCRDMMQVFDLLLEKGIELEIYDRQSASASPVHRFPEKYEKYLHAAVDYTELGKILKKARFAVNINTAKDSETMFARRVSELMACRCVVVSNASVGMKNLFGDRVWFLGEDFDFSKEAESLDRNQAYVMEHCTNYSLLSKAFDRLEQE